MSELPDLAAMFARLSEKQSERDAFCWGSYSGDQVFRGEDGYDLVWLDGLSLPELRAGLRLADPAMKLRVMGNGIVTFRDADGLPAPADGELAIRGATLRFTGVMRFAFLF
jgi:hypothetical protein